MNPNVESRDPSPERTRVARREPAAALAKRRRGSLEAETETRAAPRTEASEEAGSAFARPAPSTDGHPSLGATIGAASPRIWQTKLATSHFAPGEEVVGGGAPADSFYMIVSGVFRGVGYTSDGRRSIFAFYWPGDICGLEPEAVHRLTIEAVSHGKVTVLPRRAFHARMNEDPDFAVEMFDKTARSLSHSIEHLTTVGRGSAEECIAWFLCDLAARAKSNCNDGTYLDLAMSRQDIADYLGLTIETVSRVFTFFRKRGFISLETPKKMRIRKLELLEKFTLD